MGFKTYFENQIKFPTFKVRGKPVKFVRYGGLSPVKQFGFKRHKKGNPTFHTPPEKRGIYAFIWPYIEPFLLGGNFGGNKERKKLDKHNKPIPRTPHLLNKKAFETESIDPKTFEYYGAIWHHLGHNLNPRDIIQERGGWYKTTFENFVKALNKELHETLASKASRGYMQPDSNNGQNPKPAQVFETGGMSRYSKDHLEVFIPSGEGRIK